MAPSEQPIRPEPARRRKRRVGTMSSVTRGLSGRLFSMTVAFVLLAEAVVFVLSLGNFYKDYLTRRVNQAQIAILVHEASRASMPDTESRVDGMIVADVLERTMAQVVILNQGAAREPLFMVDNPPTPDFTVNLLHDDWLTCTLQAFDSLFAAPGRYMHILGRPLETGQSVEIIASEAPLKAALVERSINILLLSLAIAGITAVLIFVTAYHTLVMPIRRIIFSMLHFRKQPEDASRIIAPREKAGEIGLASRALNAMQRDLHGALQQKTRLAALGTAVSKINHDLRNILASAQLITDRLAAIEDPDVRRLVPRLVTSIDRAVTLCTQTLKYGRAEESPPAPRRVLLQGIVDDVSATLLLPPDGPVSFVNEVDGALEVYADPEQLFRVLLNLTRNAAQAIESAAGDDRSGGSVTVKAGTETVGGGTRTVIDVVDTGPGIPDKIKSQLFQAFVSSARAGGTGLGLAIASDLVSAHGGTLELARSGPEGTVFRIALPDAQAANDRGRPPRPGRAA